MDHLMTLATSLLSSTASRLATVNDGHNDTATYSYLANSPLVSQITYANGATTATATVIRYSAGAWRISSTGTVPASQVPAYPDDDGFGGGLP